MRRKYENSYTDLSKLRIIQQLRSVSMNKGTKSQTVFETTHEKQQY